MRPLELFMTVLIAAGLLALLAPIRMRPGWWPRLLLALPVGAALVFQLHALLEGPRGELLPLYGLGLALLAWAGAGQLLGGRSDGDAAALPTRVLEVSLALGAIGWLAWRWATLGAA